MTRPGWYADPTGQAPLRWWDGSSWTAHISAPVQGQAPVPQSEPNTKLLIAILAWALVLVGTGLALFTNVSLLTGTGTVWTGVALAIVGAVVAFVGRASAATKVIAVILVAAAVASGVYDEIQLQHKRDQLNSIINGT